jgi:hypothetical protein
MAGAASNADQDLRRGDRFYRFDFVLRNGCGHRKRDAETRILHESGLGKTPHSARTVSPVMIAQRMKAVEILEQLISSDMSTKVQDQSTYILNIAGVYQDTVTRDWAMQTCRHAAQTTGEEHIQSSWFDAHSLSDERMLLEAIRAALVADVIVVSVYCAKKLPREIYRWIEAWLPRRLSRKGALAALIGFPEPPELPSASAFDYLQAVAARAQLDFIPAESPWPVASPISSMKLLAERASTTSQERQQVQGQLCNSFYHWGINE